MTLETVDSTIERREGTPGVIQLDPVTLPFHFVYNSPLQGFAVPHIHIPFL